MKPIPIVPSRRRAARQASVPLDYILFLLDLESLRIFCGYIFLNLSGWLREFLSSPDFPEIQGVRWNLGDFLVSPVSRKSAWINFGFEKVKLEKNADNSGREFFGGPENLEKQGRKIRYRDSPSKFAEKFAGNFPKIRRTKIKNSPQIRSA